jgi:hypothetical protein
MDTNVVLIIVGATVGSLALVVGIILLFKQAQKRRTEELQTAAYSLGYEFDETDRSLLEGEFGQLPFFKRGRGGRSRNIVRRSNSGREVRLFDYTYTTGGGQHSSTHRQSVVALFRKERSLPAFELRPENVFHRIASVVGFQDIDFDDSPAFSNRYLLRGADESAVRNLFAPSIRQRLVEEMGWFVEADGGWLMLTRHGKLVRPLDAISFLEECQALEKALGGY